jgi:rabenosyn-5
MCACVKIASILCSAKQISIEKSPENLLINGHMKTWCNLSEGYVCFYQNSRNFLWLSSKLWHHPQYLSNTKSGHRDPDKPPDHTQITEATKVRKRLTDSFIQYESAARRIRDLHTSSPTQSKLQKAVYQQASGFISLNMLPLKSLPKILKHASPHGAMNSNGKTLPNGRPVGALSSIRYNDRLETSSQHSSSAIESLEAEEKELREKLIVLEEQKFMVTEMLSEARRLRRFEEMTALSSNIDDLTREVDSLRARLSRVEGDFEGLYKGLASPRGSITDG